MSDLSVRLGREEKHRLGCMHGIHQRGILAAIPLVGGDEFRKLIVQVRDIHLDAAVFYSVFLDPRAE